MFPLDATSCNFIRGGRVRSTHATLFQSLKTRRSEGTSLNFAQRLADKTIAFHKVSQPARPDWTVTISCYSGAGVARFMFHREPKPATSGPAAPAWRARPHFDVFPSSGLWKRTETSSLPLLFRSPWSSAGIFFFCSRRWSRSASSSKSRRPRTRRSQPKARRRRPVRRRFLPARRRHPGSQRFPRPSPRARTPSPLRPALKSTAPRCKARST